ncbi:uncharacterized protein MONOS_3082 [Monocercomonoides exilis]|uniref:uncharacterized protein n=1 Tax=Monocercomonoides exilis TaxID=2049356 RepID=UPI00355A09C1|nr:hypothetical protein MONOS_3082 [Monocercomonoides exilis]|eukprot:MONOS_3082.1-p1 / transcript=MONOS_3082.1 / gene=MONOS_3082 / organism=Monocercomonoides_exilis_PA203 / gene_product=unspecified product / transcript_product=unspecified product / location=Mono_scaffold00069:42928-44298(-) / protein_length=432 / sequence_SO=supercontig / SO=protein_coding / is_pseudo=false
MQQMVQNECAALLHLLGKALFHLFNQLGSPQLPKPITIPSSHTRVTGGILENAANSFLSLLCGTRLFSLGEEDEVRDEQLVESMRKEMNEWRGEGRAAVEGGDEARGTAELFCEERGINGAVPDAQNKINRKNDNNNFSFDAVERGSCAISANILLDPLLFASSVFFEDQQLLLSASENAIFVALLRIEYTQKEGQYSILPSLLKFSWVPLVYVCPFQLSHPLTPIVITLPSKLLSASFTSSSEFSIPSLFTSCVASISISQSMPPFSTIPSIVSFSAQPLCPSAASSNLPLLRLLATRAALNAIVTATLLLMVKKDLPHKISALFETHYDQKPSSSPSMSISASLIQRLKAVGASFTQQATPSAFASVQQTSEPQSTSLVLNVSTNSQNMNGSSNAAVDGANTTSVGNAINASGTASGKGGELSYQIKMD